MVAASARDPAAGYRPRMAGVELMTPKMLDRMRESCQLAAQCLVMVGEHIRAGITTESINTLVHEFCVEHDAYPAPLNYKGFPKSVCTSINDCICHGIPSPDAVLKDGDIVNVDVTTIFMFAWELEGGGWAQKYETTKFADNLMGELLPLHRAPIRVFRSRFICT